MPDSTSTRSLSNAEPQGNGALIRWMAGMTLARPGRWVPLLGLQLALLALMLAGLTYTGLAIDVLRHAADPSTPAPRWPVGVAPPMDWSPMRRIVSIAVTILGIAMLRAALRMVAALITGSLVQTILTDLRSRVYEKLQRLSFRFFDANETGSIINRATSDSSGIATFAETGIIQSVVLTITLVVYFIYMLRLQATLAMVGLLTTPLMAIASVIYSRAVRPGYEKNRTLYDRVVLSLSENIQGHHVVKGFALERQQMEQFRAANDNFRSQQRWLITKAAAYNALVAFLNQLNVMVVLVVGGIIVIRHRSDPQAAFTVGGLVIFAALLREFSNQVALIANVANTLQLSLTAAGRVREVLLAPLEIFDSPSAQPLGQVRGDVEFRNVSFAYEPGEPVLKDVSFTAKPGECIAILGATGAGKSSLLSLLPRFYDPTSGQVLLDGRDLRDLPVDELRRKIGIVFQESFLFSNTIAANIAFGQPTATREQIERAARIASAHDFIQDLPDGYDTVIGEQGSTLSGGQRQRLAIARAIVLEPPILLLDDATAAIDPETEHEILTAINSAIAGRTTFVVAHRLSMLRRADRVIVLEHGRIVQVGKHAELMVRDGHYAKVALTQVADAESRSIIRTLRWEAGEIATPLLSGEELS